MKLYSSPATPFGRKAAIVAREHGIALDIVNVNPFDSDELERLNPVRLIPVLVAEPGDGSVLYDSHVICACLDEIGSGPTLYPEADKWDWQRRATLGTALAEASVAWVFQKRLPAAQQSERMKSHYERRVLRIAAALDAEADALAAAPFRMDHIAAVCGIGHLEFRHDAAWRADCPRLTAWYEDMLGRPSVAATVPTD
jgi:glutathione S-transferase